MNRLTKEITFSMHPVAALIAYCSEKEYRGKEHYLEFRNIGNNGMMSAGKPVSLEFIQSLTENFSVKSNSIPYGEIPKELWYADTREEKYIWHRPPCRKQMYFKKELNVPNGTYAIPGLVWMVKRETLYLFAYKSKRLSHNSQLYSAPFFNVDAGSGSVCLGNAKLKKPEVLTFLNFLQFWEDKFFLSEFSHVLGGNPTKHNLVLVMKKSIDMFDNEELKPVEKLKFKDLISTGSITI
jgi:PRTRC genetic system protein B